MQQKTVSNKNYVEHYRLDAEYSDYFEPGPAERQNIRRRYQFFQRQLRPRAGQAILEIGSGGGEALNILAEDVTYFPLDLSPKNLSEIRKRAKNRISPTLADALELPYKDASFDGIILSEVLEHVTEPLVVLKEMERVLKPGGRALISVPYREKITYHVCVHCNKPTPTNAHLHTFNENSLGSLVRDAGFKPATPKLLGNKLLALMRFPQLSAFSPYAFWRFTDKLLNVLIPKASHMAILVRK